MEGNDKHNESDINRMMDRIQSLETRLSRIESQIAYWGGQLGGSGQESTFPGYVEESGGSEEDGSGSILETNIGKYALGWLSNIVFIFGIVFVMSYVQSIGSPGLSIAIGFIGVVGMFLFGYLLRKSFEYMSFLINVSAFLLLFYITASLHFFTSTPLLTSKLLTIFLLILVSVGQFYLALRRNSEALAGVGIFMLLITAILSNTTHVMLPITALAATAAFYFFYRYEWWRIFLLSIFSVYLVHTLWLFNDPMAGNEMKTVGAHQYNLVYLLFYGAVFSLPLILRHWEKAKDGAFISIMLFNALGFCLTALLVILVFYPENYAWIFGVVAVVCLSYSVALKMKAKLPYAPAFYACYGFIALSVAIYGYFNLPNSYLLLALESLLVISMAIWFKSTIIIVVNTLLFFFLLVFYMATTESVDSINFVFAFAALATARVLNWQKERLSLRTEIFRNFFLFAAFVMVLYALYHVVPPQYVTLAWTGAAGMYFLLSFLLKNVKYRWMAFGTFLVTAFYLFFIDLKTMEMVYRIIAFLFLAVISLGASLYYTKRLSKNPK